MGSLRVDRALYGFRGLALLLIVLIHQVWFGPRDGLPTGFFQATSPFRSGMDLFFVLSGYLVTQGLLATRSRPDYFKHFFVRRGLKIVPPYYFVLIAVAVLAPASIRNEWPSYAFFYRNYEVARTGWIVPYLDVTWSLCAEVHFYVAIAFLVRWLPRKGLVAALLLSLFAAPYFRGLAMARGAPLAAYAETLCRMDGFAMGGLVAVAVDTWGVRSRWRWPFYALAVTAGAFVVQSYRVGGWDVHSWPVTVPGFSASVLAAGAGLYAVCLAPNEAWVRRLLSTPLLSAWGPVCYSAYLVHMPVQDWVHHRLFPALGASVPGDPVARLFLFILLTNGLLMGVSQLLYRAIEKPVLVRRPA